MPEDYSLSLTYADDLATGILNAIEVKTNNTVYNTISQNNVSLRQVVNTAAAKFNRAVEFIDAHESLLEKNDLDTSAFPLFVPFNLTIDVSNWLRDFSVTPVDFAATIEATIQYHDSMDWTNPKAGVSVEIEKKFLGV